MVAFLLISILMGLDLLSFCGGVRRHTLEDGTRVEAGQVQAIARCCMTVTFKHAVSGMRIALVATTSFNESDAVTPRVRNIDFYRV